MLTRCIHHRPCAYSSCHEVNRSRTGPVKTAEAWHGNGCTSLCSSTSNPWRLVSLTAKQKTFQLITECHFHSRICTKWSLASHSRFRSGSEQMLVRAICQNFGVRHSLRQRSASKECQNYRNSAALKFKTIT